MYIDYCFKLNHLTRADTSGDIWEVGSKRPPFSRFFIQDDEVVAHLRDPQSKLLPDESRLQCSDFKADEVYHPPITSVLSVPNQLIDMAEYR